jgi:D-amino-acid dehydrogenase
MGVSGAHGRPLPAKRIDLMHVIVLGAGVIGTTTAWFLLERGHQVTVIDREPRPASGTSFANAGQLSYGYATPWAAPGVPLKALRWLLQADAPLKIHLDRTTPLHQWGWLARMLMQCNRADYERNKRRMLAMSTYSRESLEVLLGALPALSFDYQRRGTLQVFRDSAQYEAARHDAELIERAGVACELIARPDRWLELEPGLEYARATVLGALHLPNDASGDCAAFTRDLARECILRGARFLHDTRVLGFDEPRVGEIRAVLTSSGEHRADAYVVALGPQTSELLGELGLRVPIYPVKGYSLTFDLDRPDMGPVSTLMDETYKVAITRLGDRVRVGGTAELSGFDRRLRPARLRTLQKSVSDLFPKAGLTAEASFWTGHRPATPDSVPYVGRAFHPNLFINAGQGTLGWTMAAGSARALAALLSDDAASVPTGVIRHLGERT